MRGAIGSNELEREFGIEREIVSGTEALGGRDERLRRWELRNKWALVARGVEVCFKSVQYQSSRIPKKLLFINHSSVLT